MGKNKKVGNPGLEAAHEGWKTQTLAQGIPWFKCWSCFVFFFFPPEILVLIFASIITLDKALSSLNLLPYSVNLGL